MVIEETTAYVVTSWENEFWGNGFVDVLNVIDASDPRAPMWQGVIPIPSVGFPSMVTQNRFLFCAYSQLDIFDIRNSENPFQAGFSREVQSPLAIRGPWVYGDGGWGNSLRILYMECLPGFTEPGSPFSGLQLYQNYPNPFRSSTTIEYSVLESEFVEIDIFNILGQHVVNLEKKTFHIDFQTTAMTTWDGKDKYGNMCAGGVYICRIRAGGCSKSIKIVKL